MCGPALTDRAAEGVLHYDLVGLDGSYLVRRSLVWAVVSHLADWEAQTMTLRETAQKALEALEKYHGNFEYGDPFTVQDGEKCEAVIADLRAALAEPQEKYIYGTPILDAALKTHGKTDKECKRHSPCEADESGYCGRCHSEAYS